MIQGNTVKRFLPALSWALAFAFLPLWAHLRHRPVLWDTNVYRQAVLSIHAGHDPYAEGIATQLLIRDHPELNHSVMPPFSYPYSPVTLPLLRWIAQFPLPLTAATYLLFYVVGTALSLYVCLQICEPPERSTAALLAPLVLFFPGIVYNDVIFSGNVANILYGLILLAALLGWRRDRWTWFYLAVLIASCIKAPLLILLAIPVLSSRRPWIGTSVTAFLGISIFALQPHIWPALFRNYLTAVELQFSINHDFGASPSGMVADTLFDKIPYKTTLTVFYVLYAIPIALLLLYLRNRWLQGRFSLKEWIPILILGVTLLNPRIMEYDIAPITLLMGLAAWRIVSRNVSALRALLTTAAFFIMINSFARIMWRPIECATIGIIFFLGVYKLLTTSTRLQPLPSTNLSS